MTAPPHLAIELGARLGVLAGLWRIDPTPITDHLALLDADLLGAQVWLELDRRRIAVRGALSARPERIGELAALPGGARLARTALARPGAAELTLTAGEVGAALTLRGRATLADDGVAAAALGFDPAAWATLAARVAALGAPAAVAVRAFELRVDAAGAAELWATTDITSGAALLPRLLAAAADVGAGAAQRDLIARLHPLLAADQPMLVSFGIGAAGPLAAIELSYAAPALADTQRVCRTLAVGGEATLGQITGALGSEHIAALGLTLGPRDPLPARVALQPLRR